MLLILFFITTLSMKPIFLVPGFEDSPLYSYISNASLYPECPPINGKIFIQDSKESNIQFLSYYPNCAAKLLRVQINSKTRKVEQLPGIITNSTFIDDSIIYSDTFRSIISKIEEYGYQNNINFFGIGYNYYFHPFTSYLVYDKLKNKIEQIYNQTGEKSIFISYDQGTSFTSIFLSNYSHSQWVNKYIDSAIFLSPTFDGLLSFPQLLTQTMKPFISNDELKKSIMRMPGLHIRLPNYVSYDHYYIETNLTKKIDYKNVSHTFEFLKEIGKVDHESELIFKSEVEKYLKNPVPDPRIPTIIIDNDKKPPIESIYHFKGEKSIISHLICPKWKSVHCSTFHADNILNSKEAIESIINFLKERGQTKSSNLLENVETLPIQGTTGDFADTYYVKSHSIQSSNFICEAPSSASKMPIYNAFDNDINTYYASNVENNETYNNTIIFIFEEAVTLEAFLYDPVYMTTNNTRTFYGFPTLLYVYASFEGSPFSLKVIYSGNPVYPMKRIQFVFPEVIKCDQLKLEFVEITKQVSPLNLTAPMIGNIFLMQYSGMSPPNQYYLNPLFLKSHLIDDSKYNYSGTEGMTSYPLSNAFNGDFTNYYISSIENSDTFNNSILINFHETVTLESFIYHTVILYTDQYILHGGPVKLCLYYSIGNEPLKFYKLINVNQLLDWEKIQYIFQPPLECDKLKIEFVEVTEQQIKGKTKSPVIANLQFYRYLGKPIEFSGLEGKYMDSVYVSSHIFKPPKFDYSGTEGLQNYNLSLAFDEINTYYISSIPIDDRYNNTIEIDFKENVSVEAFIIDPCYKSSSNSRTFYGYPLLLYVYSSIGNEPFQLNTIFYGNPIYPHQTFQFVFEKIVNCDKLKFVFLEVTLSDYIVSSSPSLTINNLRILHPYETTSIRSDIVKYDNDDYVQINMVPYSEFTYDAPEGKQNYPITNAFDFNNMSFYISSKVNDVSYLNTIIINFDKLEEIEAILYDTAFATRNSARTYYGYPIALYVYTSIDNNPFVLNTIFAGLPVYPMSRVQFVFKELTKCNKIKLEFEEVTVQTVDGNGKNPIIANLYFMREEIPTQSPSISPIETPSISPLETPSIQPTETPSISPKETETFSPSPTKQGSIQVPITDVCNGSLYCNYEGDIDTKMTITITESIFNNNKNEDGGTVRLKNVGILCETVSFSSCQTRTGGGGAIYIDNEGDNQIVINDTHFSNCKADYGGAVYARSISVLESVIIIKCVFSSCQSFSFESTESNSLYGGSALFLSSKKSTIVECIFSNNIGDSQLKIFNEFNKNILADNNSNNNNKSSDIIKYCRFEINKQSKCSLYYFGGNDGVSCYVHNSIFVGDLQVGNYHINGKCNRFSPKIIINACKFSNDYQRSIKNENDIEYVVVVYQKQTFNYEEKDNSNDKDVFSYSMIAVGFVMLVIVVVLIKKQIDSNRWTTENLKS